METRAMKRSKAETHIINTEDPISLEPVASNAFLSFASKRTAYAYDPQLLLRACTESFNEPADPITGRIFPPSEIREIERLARQMDDTIRYGFINARREVLAAERAIEQQANSFHSEQNQEYLWHVTIHTVEDMVADLLKCDTESILQFVEHVYTVIHPALVNIFTILDPNPTAVARIHSAMQSLFDAAILDTVNTPHLTALGLIVQEMIERLIESLSEI
jgi:2'-5' RNA ligase